MEDPKDPWTRHKRENDDPPDIIELIKKFFSGNSSGSGNDHVGRYIGIAVGVIVLIWVLVGIFVVKPAEETVVLRFGKYLETVGPGPHWVPRFIDSTYTIDVQQVRDFNYQAEMLTTDENIVSVQLAVQYRIANPKNFLFNVVDPVKTLQQATSSAVRQVVGQMTLDTVLTTGRQQLRDQVDKQLQQILDLYKTGITVTDVNLQPAKPPEQVTHAFDDAIKAREDEQRYINQAEAYARRVTSIAQGKVSRLMQSANAYKQEVVLHAEGQVARYTALLKPYEASPTVTRDRLYLDTVSNILSKTTNVFVDSGANNVLYLPLDQIVKQAHAKVMDGKSLMQMPSDQAVAPVESHSSATVNSNNTHRQNTQSYGADRPSYSLGGQS